MVAPLVYVLGAAGVGLGYLILKPKLLTEGQKQTQAALPDNAPAASPPLSPMAEQLAAYNAGVKSEYAKPGEGAVVWLTFDPNDHSRANHSRAFRFIGISGNLPSDERDNPALFNENYAGDIVNFQVLSSGNYSGNSGVMDGPTQDELWRQVLAINAKNHNANVAAGLRDSDWITVQNKAGAEDPRGKWSVSGVSLSVPGLPTFGGLADLFAGRAGHRQANLVGGRAGHRQANLVGGQVQLFGKRWGRGGAHANLVGQADLIGGTAGVDLLREGRRLARKHLGI